MRVEIKFVETEEKQGKNGKPYKVVEVTYKNDRNETKSYRHFEFNNPELATKLGALKKGDVIEVQTMKNDKGYLDWVAIDAPGNASGGSPPKGAFVPDAERQRLIVRQSSLGHAVAFHNGNKGSEGKSTVDQVIVTAAEFEKFVFGERAGGSPIDIEEDIPV